MKKLPQNPINKMTIALKAVNTGFALKAVKTPPGLLVLSYSEGQEKSFS